MPTGVALDQNDATAAGGMPDQQVLYQQHLAHWQAAFQEYWKCCSAAGMPPWQGMMGGSYGSMPFYGSGMMNPYANMVGAAAAPAAVSVPSAAPPAAAAAPAAAPAAPAGGQSQSSMPAGMGLGPGALAPVPVPVPAAPAEAAAAATDPLATTATTATSSLGGLSKALGLESDADSPLTSGTQEDMPQCLQLPLATSYTAAAGQLESALPAETAVTAAVGVPAAAAAAASPAAAPDPVAFDLLEPTAEPEDLAPLYADAPVPIYAEAPADPLPAAAAAAAALSAVPSAVTAAAPTAAPAAVTTAVSATVSAAAPAAVPAVVLPSSSVPAATPMSLQVLGLTQPATLPMAAVSQTVQMPGVADAGGMAGIGHAVPQRGIAGLPLLGDDGQPMDEKDIKRLRRKQSNRESARRSRLRKQAENDTLQQRLAECEAARSSLLTENAGLKQRLEQMVAAVAKLTQDKAALIAQVRSLGGQVSADMEGNPAGATNPSTRTATAQPSTAAAAAASAAGLAAPPGLPEQLRPASVAQLHGIAVASGGPGTVTVIGGNRKAGSALPAAAVLTSA